jgi:hypothetical protein
VRNHDGFGNRYRAARLLLLEYWSNEIADLADRASLDLRDRHVRIDTRKGLLSKLAPRRYGDGLLHAGDPENPVQVMHAQVSLENLSVAQLDALEKAAASKAARRQP